MRLSSDGRVTIPKSLRIAACLSEGDEFEAEVIDQGILLRPRVGRDPDQWWYWAAEWQAGERQIDRDRVDVRRGPLFDSGEDFLNALSAIASQGAGEPAASR